MSPKLQPVRGTHDILPVEFEKFQTVVTLAQELATLYGFRAMATPIFESTEVFSRSIGETSDVVSKEMFTFHTKGEESVTLRPEFTAGNVRAFISNGMQQDLPLKLFSSGPVFRYERPQKGRQRQFHQVNYEWLGDDSAEADVELIILAGQLLFQLAGRKSCTLMINTLGDKESRDLYRDALVAYLTPYKDKLSEDSQRRLISNPLRILDSKDPRDQSIKADAPKISEYLTENAKNRFVKVWDLLNDKNVPFFQEIKSDPSLVRGLDYYCHTVFEFVDETGELGAQNTVLAGGRYDGLVEQMGGKPTAAIGFAAGVERLLLLSKAKFYKAPDPLKIIVLPYEGIKETITLNVAQLLRLGLFDLISELHIKLPLSVEILWNGTLKKRMERASKQNATHVVLLPPEEIQRGSFVIKNMKTGQQQEKTITDLNSKEALKVIFLNKENSPS